MLLEKNRIDSGLIFSDEIGTIKTGTSKSLNNNNVNASKSSIKLTEETLVFSR